MKKFLSIALAAIMVACITATAFAASTSTAKITGMAQNLSAGYSGSTDLGNISPQDNHVEYIDLTDAMFTWDEDYVPTATPASLATSQIRNAKLTVRATNNKVLEDVSINTSKSRIEVKFLEELAGITEVDFDFDIILSVNGRRQNDFAMNFYGTFANPIYEVYAETEREDTSRGEVIEAMEYINSIALDAGFGVSVNTRMIKGSRGYATATLSPDKTDEAIFAKYKEIEDVINLKTVGIYQSATVKLEVEYKDYYVFSKTGEYLGRGNDSLLLTDKYYLAKEMVGDFINDDSVANGDSANAPNPTDADTDSISGSTVADNPAGYPINIHDNPNTGR